MFKFFKDKLNDVVKKFSKEVEEESEVVEQEQPKEVEEKKSPTKSTKTDKPDKIVKKDKKNSESKEVKAEKKETKQTKPEKEKESKKEKEVSEDKHKNNSEKDTASKKEIKHDDKKEDVASSEEDDHEPEEVHEKKGFFSKLFKKKEDVKEEPSDDEASDIEDKEEIKESSEKLDEKKPEKEKPKETIFKKVSDTFTKFSLSDEKFEELFWDLEVTLLENNVAVEVIQKIKDDLKEELTKDKISRKNPHDIIQESLAKSLKEVLDVPSFDLESAIKKKKPYVIAVIGVNGSGKTTTIAKLCNMLKQDGFSIVLAAADTFRAAAIQQLEEHANNLGIKMIKHDYNSDPAAVAFDAVKHAESKNLDVVIIDTAGRLHSNDNLMNELRKLIRVNTPDFKLFVGESITGNDCVEQAKTYNEMIGIDGIILSKADIDEKGGAALSISYVTKKPVLFIGTGQEYKDLKEFNKDDILKSLGL